MAAMEIAARKSRFCREVRTSAMQMPSENGYNKGGENGEKWDGEWGDGVAKKSEKLLAVNEMHSPFFAICSPTPNSLFEHMQQLNFVLNGPALASNSADFPSTFFVLSPAIVCLNGSFINANIQPTDNGSRDQSFCFNAVTSLAHAPVRLMKSNCKQLF